MKKEFHEYLVAIGTTEAFRKDAEELIAVAQRLSPEPIDDIFVLDYVTNSGQRVHESIDLFSRNYWMGIKRDTGDVAFIMGPLRESLGIVEVKATKYDFVKATSESRVFVSVQSRTGDPGVLKASGGNCDCLASILRKYFTSSIVHQPDTNSGKGT